MTELNLRYNSIGGEGAKAIAEALKVNPVLNNLDLGYNSIGDDGAKAIAVRGGTEGQPGVDQPEFGW